MYSCTKPMTALTATITSITVPSRKLPITKEMAAAAMSTMTRRSLNWERKRSHRGVSSLAVSSFLPCSARRRPASSRARPFPPVSRASRTSLTFIR